MNRRITLLRRMAIACAVLVLAVTTLSAFIRLSRPAPPCETPHCLPAAVHPGGADASDGVITSARITHRIAASAVLLLIVGMLMNAFATAPVLREPGRLVLVLLGLALFLAVLGRMAGDSRSPEVVLGNLLAGFALLAVNCRLLLVLYRGAGPVPRSRTLGWSALALLAAAAALGGVAAATAPDGLPALLHQGGGVLAAASLLALGVRVWRQRRTAGAALVTLLALELATGALIAFQPPQLAPALAHNLLAALLAGAVATLAGEG